MLFQFATAHEHLSEVSSPILGSTTISKENSRKVWIPNSYGGVTKVILHLEHIGTNKMLQSINETGNVTNRMGKQFKLQSDKTTHDTKKGVTQRTVILVNKEWQKKHGFRGVICYKVTYQKALKNNEGVQLQSKGTNYSLTISAIKDEYEVLYLIPFANNFPNSTMPYATKPKKDNRVGDGF